MSGSFLLVGILADARMLAVLGLSGTLESLQGRLVGGARAGIDRDRWPAWAAGPGTLAAMRVVPNAALERYARVMGLEAWDHPGGPIMGLGRDEAQGEPQPALAAEIARLVLAAAADRPAEAVARRLPAIGIWAASRLRAAAGIPGGDGVVARRGPDDTRILARDEPYAGFFSVQVSDLRHRTHAGGLTPVLRREALILGDAVVVLPWDPVRDRVLVIEQFRVAPLLRNDPQPWLLEPVAGRVDAGETVEEAAHREAREEADLTLSRLIPALHHYPSPGVLAEYLYGFVGIADLPDGAAGVHGLACEAEDIRGHLIDRARLTRMAVGGRLANGPLATMALWLELRQAQIRAQLGLA